MAVHNLVKLKLAKEHVKNLELISEVVDRSKRELEKYRVYRPVAQLLAEIELTEESLKMHLVSQKKILTQKGQS